jgi:hypothetical protein
MTYALLFSPIPGLFAVRSSLGGQSPTLRRRAQVACAADATAPGPIPPRRPARRARKPNGYWLDMSNLRSELETYAVLAHLPLDEMPTAAALRAANRRDLDNAITKAGGYRAVARELGLSAKSDERKPHGYWKHFANIKAELHDFAAVHLAGDTSNMPSLADLRAAQRMDIVHGIEQHGGFETVADRMGLEYVAGKKKKAGYWKDWNVVASELTVFVAARTQRQVPPAKSSANPAVMPSQGELVRAGRSDLSEAISDFHGGFAAAAAKMGYQPRHRDWSLFCFLAREVYAFIREHNRDLPVMPTTAMLKARGRTDLMNAITKYGGMSTVAARLGLKYVVRPRNAFRDWNLFLRVLLAFSELHGFEGRLPSSRELQTHGRPDLYQAILWHGGPADVAMRARLRPTNFWQDFHYVGHLLLEFINTHGTPGMVCLLLPITSHGRPGFVLFLAPWNTSVFSLTCLILFCFNVTQSTFCLLILYVLKMPTENEFEQVGQRTLRIAVAQFGYTQVAMRLGLKEPMHASQDTPRPSLAISQSSCNDCNAGDGKSVDMDLVDIDETVLALSLSLDDIMNSDLANG